MSVRVRTALALAALLLGIALIAYPYVSDYFAKLNQVGVVQDHDAYLESQSSEALQHELEASFDYNRRLLASRTVITDPFDPSNMPVTDEEYEARVNVAGDGVMGSIVIPAINVTVPLYHGTSDEVLQKGAGHLQATSLPVGGPSTHAVVAGHNGLPSVRIFDDLHKLHEGDYFVVRVLGEEHAYRIYGIETVEPEDTSSLVIEDGKDLMTLITCTPYGINSHRLLVHAERCEVPEEWYSHDKDAAAEAEADPTDAILPLTLAGLAVGAGALAARQYAQRKRRRTMAAAGIDGIAGGAGAPSRADGATPSGFVPLNAVMQKKNEPRGKHARRD